ncbi:hypothetical protein [Caldilinea sp.]|jgi:hypothetical protein|uniref:hypothetical protein n=1 Tax=Caldilinea sp. TaxID=2293560 RepID=UPI0021DD7C6D|nr:hypothetical protein [Caldilinea sp.]GIV69355.1 MAG: hypothetical protein KatS3mg048_2217 [Caldilinea sp.]
MNEPKQTQLNIEKTGWTQLTLLDDAPGPRLIAIRSALRCAAHCAVLSLTMSSAAVGCASVRAVEWS